MFSGRIIIQLLHVANRSQVLIICWRYTLYILHISGHPATIIVFQGKCLIKRRVLYTRTTITLIIHRTSTDHY